MNISCPDKGQHSSKTNVGWASRHCVQASDVAASDPGYLSSIHLWKEEKNLLKTMLQLPQAGMTIACYTQPKQKKTKQKLNVKKNSIRNWGRVIKGRRMSPDFFLSSLFSVQGLPHAFLVQRWLRSRSKLLTKYCLLQNCMLLRIGSDLQDNL